MQTILRNLLWHSIKFMTFVPEIFCIGLLIPISLLTACHSSNPSTSNPSSPPISPATEKKIAPAPESSTPVKESAPRPDSESRSAVVKENVPLQPAWEVKRPSPKAQIKILSNKEPLEKGQHERDASEYVPQISFEIKDESPLTEANKKMVQVAIQKVSLLFRKEQLPTEVIINWRSQAPIFEGKNIIRAGPTASDLSNAIIHEFAGHLLLNFNSGELSDRVFAKFKAAKADLPTCGSDCQQAFNSSFSATNYLTSIEEFFGDFMIVLVSGDPSASRDRNFSSPFEINSWRGFPDRIPFFDPHFVLEPIWLHAWGLVQSVRDNHDAKRRLAQMSLEIILDEISKNINLIAKKSFNQQEALELNERLKLQFISLSQPSR